MTGHPKHILVIAILATLAGLTAYLVTSDRTALETCEAKKQPDCFRLLVK